MPFLLLMLPATASADALLVAVASNFVRPAEALAAHYEQQSGRAVALSPGSTGKLYAQVVNGAPYDVLLAADARRPEMLEASGHGVAGSRFTYATGRLVLWSPDPALNGADCRAELDRLGRRHLAIANPLTAPYGAAAKSVLVAEGLYERLEANLVYGENIAQALHFVVSGNASLGLVAAAQLADDRLPATACEWPVPEDRHAPIEQQAILLKHGLDNEAARGFLAFLGSADGKRIIGAYGYGVN